MSYEGYEVVYCVCGVRKRSNDAYDSVDPEDEKPCVFCGSTKTVTDCIDETNGCYCDELAADYSGDEENIDNLPTCPAHEKIDETDIVGWAMKQCTACNGEGYAETVQEWENAPCDCDSKPSCAKCYGTGLLREESVWTETQCHACKGTGKLFVPRYNVSKLKRG